MLVSFVTVTLTDKCWSTPNHFKKLIFQVGKCPILEYFHEIQLDVSKKAQYPHKYVCFHYIVSFVTKNYLINVETHQITWNVIFQVGRCPNLEYFHEIHLVVSEYAKYLNHMKKLIFQVGICPNLEYFHEIQLNVSNYAKYSHKYVCFHYKSNLS